MVRRRGHGRDPRPRQRPQLDRPARWDGTKRASTPWRPLRGPQPFVIVSEPGLYSLILRSRKPEAKAFKRWVNARGTPVDPAHRFIRADVPGRVPGARLRPRRSCSSPRPTTRQPEQLVTARRRRPSCAPAAEAWGVLAEAEGDYSLRGRRAHLEPRSPHQHRPEPADATPPRPRHGRAEEDIPYVRYSRYLVERPIAYSHPHTGEADLKLFRSGSRSTAWSTCGSGSAGSARRRREAVQGLRSIRETRPRESRPGPRLKEHRHHHPSRARVPLGGAT